MAVMKKKRPCDVPWRFLIGGIERRFPVEAFDWTIFRIASGLGLEATNVAQ